MIKNLKFILLFICMVSLMLTACDKNVDESNNHEMNNLQNKTKQEKKTKEEKKETEENTSENNKEEIDEPGNETKVVEIDYNKVKPNELGHILIIMYHGLVEDNPPSPYQRKIEDFKNDLIYLYENGYRTISMRDYIDNNISVEPGYTPIIITFDDGISTSFSLVKENGELKPTPNSAVDIMNKFYEEHPDFGKNAVFYINGDDDPFAGAGTFNERLQYLIDNGYEVSNHTYGHVHLSQLTGDEIQEQLGKVDRMIKEALPDYVADSFSYPFGERPKEELRHHIEKGIYNATEYHYKIALREGPSGPFVPINHIKFTPFNLPRVRGSDGEEGDLWWYLKYYEEHPEYKYISDGNPKRISILKEQENNINPDSLGDKELYIYSIEE